ncbi:MAG TPA: hypothetical protein VMU88_08880 [bacterium]|nr:hypothetical protein [bacterium]
MKASASSLLFIALLGAATILLPACGGNQVKSNDATTMMNAEPTPEATVASTASSASTGPENSYEEKTVKSHKSVSTQTQPAASLVAPAPAASTPMPAAATAATPVVENTTPAPKGGSHFLWWLLLILILAGIGWYFWSKNHNDEDEFQPHPPSGGLSPVSGFTGTKELEAKKAPSIWTRKLF